MVANEAEHRREARDTVMMLLTLGNRLKDSGSDSKEPDQALFDQTLNEAFASGEEFIKQLVYTLTGASLGIISLLVKEANKNGRSYTAETYLAMIGAALAQPIGGEEPLTK